MNKLIFSLVLLSSAATFAAPPVACPLPAKKINVEMKDAPVIDLLKLVFKEAGVKNQISETPSLHSKISMNVRDADICDVFNFAISEAKLTYKVQVEAAK